MANIEKIENKWAYFNGTTNYIQYADNDIFSFTNGVNDLPFEIEFDFIDNGLNTNLRVITYKGRSAFGYEWSIRTISNTLLIRLWGSGASIYIGASVPILLNTLYHAKIIYNGSKLWSGIKIFLNGVDTITTSSNNGVYTGMINNNSEFTIGTVGETAKSNYWKGYLRNLKIKKNGQLVFFTPLTDSLAISKDVIGGLVHNAGTLPIVRDLSNVVLKDENKWLSINSPAVGNIPVQWGTVSSFNFIQQTGKFLIEFEAIKRDTARQILIGTATSQTVHVGFYIDWLNTGILSFQFITTGAGGTNTNITISAGLLNTPYKFKIWGDGTYLYLSANNVQATPVLINSLVASDAYVAIRIGLVNSSFPSNCYIRNLKIYNYNNLMLFLPLQDYNNLSFNVIDGTSGTVDLDYCSVVNKLESERWAYFENSSITIGTTSTLGWINSGVFNMQFDLKLLKVPSSSAVHLYTTSNATQYGFNYQFLTTGQIRLYWCNGTGSYAVTLFPSNSVLGTNYHYLLQGNGTQIRLYITNTDSGVDFYDSGWINCAYVPNATTSNLLIIGRTVYNAQWQLKNFTIYTDTEGTQPFLSLPFQDPDTIAKDVVGGLVGTNTNVRLIDNGQNVMKDRNLWVKFPDGSPSSYVLIGSTSTFGWMNSGVFKVMFDVIIYTPKAGAYLLDTSSGVATYGFIISNSYSGGISRLQALWTDGSGSYLINNLGASSISNNVPYRIIFQGDGTHYRYIQINLSTSTTVYDSGWVEKTFTPNATTGRALYVNGVNGTIECAMRNVYIYQSSDNSKPFFGLPLQDTVLVSKDVVGGLTGTITGSVKVVDI